MTSVRDGRRCFLKELPAEIRNDIFELALTEHSPLAVCTDDYPRWSQEPPPTKIFYALPGSKSDLEEHYDKYGGVEGIGSQGFWLLWQSKLEKRPAVPALALTCRQFFCEAMTIFHAANEFILSQAYSYTWTTAWFEVLKRLAKLNVAERYRVPNKRAMQVKHVRLHVENCANESVPSLEDAGRIHAIHNPVTGRLRISGEGMFKNLCLCELRDMAAALQGEDCLELFVRRFKDKFYDDFVNLDRSDCWLPTKCIKCSGKQLESWKDFCERTARIEWLTPDTIYYQSQTQDHDPRPTGEMRQSDIRDYFVRQRGEYH